MKFWAPSIQLILITLLIVPEAFAAGGNEMDRGISAYNAGDYRTAFDDLSQAEATQPANATLHYYKANALAQLGYSQPAIAEYQVAYQLSPQGQIAVYCRQAIISMGQSSIAANQPLNQTISEVAKETAAAKRTADQDYQRDLANARALNDNQLRAWQKREDDEIAAMQSSRINIVGPRGRVTSVSTYSLANINSVHIQYATERTRIQTANQDEFNRIAESGKQKSQTIEETGNYIENGLSAPPDSDGFKMQALGTNFYVQNYGTESGSQYYSPANAPAPLKATAKSLQYAPAGKLPGNSGGNELSVHGQLLKP